MFRRAALLFSCAFAFTLTAAPSSEWQGTFRSGGNTIRIDYLAPPGAGRGPAIVLAHGADGLAGPDGAARYRQLSASLAQRGFVVAVVHYFERTATVRADAESQVRCLPAWHETLTDAITAVRSEKRVDPQRVAIMGVSLGGTLSIAVASFDPRVSGLVDFFGGLPDVIDRQLKRLPPTLILHGEADRVVPVGEARKLEAACRRLGVRHELKIYPEAGHGFSGADLKDALDRTAAFLRGAR